MSSFILLVLQTLVTAAWLIVLGRVLMSWIDPTLSRPVSQFLFSLTEPFLAPLRNVLPRVGMFDISPLVLLIGLGLVMRVVWLL